jgi:hypothetical protein
VISAAAVQLGVGGLPLSAGAVLRLSCLERSKNISARIADGVTSLSQYNPEPGWGPTCQELGAQRSPLCAASSRSPEFAPGAASSFARTRHMPGNPASSA